MLKAKLGPIKIPNACYPIYTVNEVPGSVATVSDTGNSPMAETKCFHSNRFYDDGEQWRSSSESCTICTCNNQRTKCDPIKCPPLRCRKEEQVQKKGDCCPTCVGKDVEETNATLARGCKLGDQFYKSGSSWHPYLTDGFDTCVVCTCDALSLEISCPRTQCPPLTCSEKVAYRPDKKSCCKRCPEPKVMSPPRGTPEFSNDQGSSKDGLNSPTMIMSSGGCKSPMGFHSNGQEWHPVVALHGEQKCVTCRCKDGKINCEKKHCPRAMCQNQKNNNARKQQLQQQPKADECCQCHRARRHNQRKKQKQQDKHQNNLSKS